MPTRLRLLLAASFLLATPACSVSVEQCGDNADACYDDCETEADKDGCLDVCDEEYDACYVAAEDAEEAAEVTFEVLDALFGDDDDDC